MNEEDDIKLVTEAQERAIEYFSNRNKKNKEINIVKFFLNILQIQHHDKELIPASDEPPDVIFREACFEVKEILPKNSRRHQELKDALKKTETAKTVGDLIEHCDAQTVTLSQIMFRVEEKLHELSTICPTVRNNSDLLLYVCLATFYSLEPYNIPQNSSDWRSVSICTNSKLAIVLSAKSNAPEFIRRHVGRLVSLR